MDKATKLIGIQLRVIAIYVVHVDGFNGPVMDEFDITYSLIKKNHKLDTLRTSSEYIRSNEYPGNNHRIAINGVFNEVMEFIRVFPAKPNDVII